jgi:hypothetical protein
VSLRRTIRGEMEESVLDDDELYRRLAREHVNEDGTVNSAAYKLRGRPDLSISVDLARLTTPKQVIAAHPHAGVDVLVAHVPRSMGFDVCHAPLPHNPAHCLIEGENTRAKCRLLAEATTVCVDSFFVPEAARRAYIRDELHDDVGNGRGWAWTRRA